MSVRVFRGPQRASHCLELELWVRLAWVLATSSDPLQEYMLFLSSEPTPGSIIFFPLRISCFIAQASLELTVLSHLLECWDYTPRLA